MIKSEIGLRNIVRIRFSPQYKCINEKSLFDNFLTSDTTSVREIFSK